MPQLNDESTNRSNPQPDGWLASLMNRYAVLRILVVGHLLGPMGALITTLLLSLILSIVLFSRTGDHQDLAGIFLLLALLSLTSLVVGLGRLHSQLFKPLVQLEESVADVCQGEPWTTLPFDNVGVLGPVARDLDSLSGELIDLYEDMDNRVARQTRRLAQQTSGLKILYDVAASINQVEDMDDLLIRFLPVLRDMVHGTAATVQLSSTEGKMRLVGSLGIDNQLLTEKEQLPIPLCQCGRALSSGDVLCDNDPHECSQRNGRRMYGSAEMDMVTIPLKFHGDVLGAYRIYVKKPATAAQEEVLDLLSTIGNHLGIAIAKQRTDEEARRLSIMEERTALAHELHDSLAQTLASLRFQVRMLDETLEQDAEESQARSELNRIRNGLDEAHTELRELLNSFRAPLDQRGLEPALAKLAQRFRQETGIPIFFQRGCRQVNLGASEEMQMLRIVQESLANIRKHAQAHNVRILLSCNDENEYMLLVEDDGVGFDNNRPNGGPGEHIGLSIMEERARRLGGQIRIESEPGEGTRVEMVYKQRAGSD
jgi:two-component system nitrate/nitrite sensor histidine kinase NarX